MVATWVYCVVSARAFRSYSTRERTMNYRSGYQTLFRRQCSSVKRAFKPGRNEFRCILLVIVRLLLHRIFSRSLWAWTGKRKRKRKHKDFGFDHSLGSFLADLVFDGKTYICRLCKPGTEFWIQICKYPPPEYGNLLTSGKLSSHTREDTGIKRPALSAHHQPLRGLWYAFRSLECCTNNPEVWTHRHRVGRVLCIFCASSVHS